MGYIKFLLIQAFLGHACWLVAANTQAKGPLFVVKTIKNVGTHSVASIVLEKCLADGCDKKDAANYIVLFKALLRPPVNALCCLCGADEPGQEEDVYWLIPEKNQVTAWRSWVHTGYGQATLVRNGNAVYMNLLRDGEEEHLQEPLIKFIDEEIKEAQIVEFLLKLDTKGNHTLSRVSSPSNARMLMSPQPARKVEESLLVGQQYNQSYGSLNDQYVGQRPSAPLVYSYAADDSCYS